MKKEETQKKFNGGFSLIEIMVAIMILGVAFIGLVGAFPYALSIITEAKNRTQAAYLAQEKIEELYQYNYSAIATGTIEARHNLAASGSYAASFERDTLVTLIDRNLASTTDDNGLKMISTTVYYTNAITKREKSYNLAVILSRRQ